jgi:hypothetical protein
MTGNETRNVKKLMQEVAEETRRDLVRAKYEKRRFGPQIVLPPKPGRKEELALGASRPIDFQKQTDFKRKVTSTFIRTSREQD